MDKVKHIIIGDFKCSKKIIQTGLPSSFLAIVVQQYFEIFDNFFSHDVFKYFLWFSNLQENKTLFSILLNF